MSEYKLELKQLVDYPRSRMYREFVRSLIENKDIRVSKSCGLYYYIVLCCFANFRTSYKRVKGYLFTIYPGEWVMSISELMHYFRMRTRTEVLAVMEDMQKGSGGDIPMCFVLPLHSGDV